MFGGPQHYLEVSTYLIQTAISEAGAGPAEESLVPPDEALSAELAAQAPSLVVVAPQLRSGPCDAAPKATPGAWRQLQSMPFYHAQGTRIALYFFLSVREISSEAQCYRRNIESRR